MPMVWKRPRGKGWVLEEGFLGDDEARKAVEELQEDDPGREYVITGEYVNQVWLNAMWSRKRK